MEPAMHHCAYQLDNCLCCEVQAAALERTKIGERMDSSYQSHLFWWEGQPVVQWNSGTAQLVAWGSWHGTPAKVGLHYD